MNPLQMIRRLLPFSGRESRKSHLLQAMNTAAAVLLTSNDENFQDSLREGMGLLAHCMNVDRIYIWRNKTMDGVLCYVVEYEWTVSTGRGNARLSRGTSFSYANGAPEWANDLQRGKCINGPVHSLSEEAQKRMIRRGNESVLVIPIHFGNFFWGFVSFDDCVRTRFFSEDEVALLRSGSIMLANAVNRHEATARMREADERAKLMLDAMPLCCSLWDQSFHMIDCNEQAVSLFRLNGKQEYLERFFEFSPQYQPDGSPSAEKLLEHMRTALRDGRTSFEWMRQLSDGTPLPSKLLFVRIKRGEEYILAGYSSDLREHKQMMAEIEHKDHLLRTMNEIAAILLQTEPEDFERNLRRCMKMMAGSVSADRVYIWKNHMKDGRLCCTQLFEWSDGADPQQDSAYTVDIPYDDAAYFWKEQLSKGESINGIVREMSTAEKDHLAAQSILSILVVPVFIRNEFWGFVGFDDCHRERLFTELEESILQAGSLLIATALLRNELALDLRSAVTAAQSASNAKSIFLSNMSHEIRTPISAIIGMTGIGKASSDMGRKNYAFEKIEDASNHLLGVINDILDMSKIEANKFELSEVEFNFEKMLQKTVGVVSFRIDKKQQHFLVRLDPGIPQNLIGDDQRIAQVVANFLSNASKFTPEGGSLRLEARLQKEEDDVCFIEIEVTDTGIGISPEQQSRLFRSFEQAERTTARKYGGTGLGLSISKRIVDCMGGSIRMESELGRGSTFSFTFPAKRGTEEDRALRRPSDARERLRALLVDGDTQSWECFADMAKHLDLACDAAGDMEQALALMEANGPYHLYFVDQKIGGMDGYDLSRRIWERDPAGYITLMITGAESGDRTGMAGVRNYISKPLFPSDIVDCINKYTGVDDSEQGAPPEQYEDLSGYCALLAEDMEINREIVQSMLEPTHLTLVSAANGAEALRMFEASPDRYDLILMDVQMPEMDGLEATRRIRALAFQKARDIPIIAMTANVFSEDIETCLAAGMTDHVGKPLSFDDLTRALRRTLPRQS